MPETQLANWQAVCAKPGLGVIRSCKLTREEPNAVGGYNATSRGHDTLLGKEWKIEIRRRVLALGPNGPWICPFHSSSSANASPRQLPQDCNPSQLVPCFHSCPCPTQLFFIEPEWSFTYINTVRLLLDLKSTLHILTSSPCGIWPQPTFPLILLTLPQPLWSPPAPQTCLAAHYPRVTELSISSAQHALCPAGFLFTCHSLGTLSD